MYGYLDDSGLFSTFSGVQIPVLFIHGSEITVKVVVSFHLLLVGSCFLESSNEHSEILIFPVLPPQGPPLPPPITAFCFNYNIAPGVLPMCEDFPIGGVGGVAGLGGIQRIPFDFSCRLKWRPSLLSSTRLVNVILFGHRSTTLRTYRFNPSFFFLIPDHCRHRHIYSVTDNRAGVEVEKSIFIP